MILIADIGGTNSRIGLVKAKGKNILNLKIYKSKDFPNIYSLLERYFLELNLKKN